MSSVGPTTRSAAPPTSGARTTTPCAVPAGTATGLSAPPTGVVAFAIPGERKVPFPDRVFTDPWVSGVDLLMSWHDLEPAANTFDWSVVDCVFAQADAHHKFVVLSLMPGFLSPAWVLQTPGVQTQSFKFSYSNKAPARPLPLPWNEVYLHTWFTFLGAVAARYGTNPEFRMIEVAGPTSVSTEMSLPDRRSGDTALPASAHGSDIAEWISLGYRPDKLVKAWQESFDQYHQLFPNQYLGLALYPGLPIGNNGTEDQRERVATLHSVIAAGMRYKQQFDLQEDGMKGGAAQPNDPEYNAVRAHCGKIVTGLQNAVTATDSPDQRWLSRALDHVVAAGVDFWEVFLPDIVNPSRTDVLRQASTQLRAHKQCKR
jgi:Beta-galactosidase